MKKTSNRILALLLAAVLTAGLLPAVQYASAAKVSRASVLLGADRLLKDDTLLLGSAQNASVTYPMEWQVLDASADSLGRSGGKLLISKYLLPAAVTDTATGGLDTAASYGASVTMPDSAAVLSVTKSEDSFTANLGQNALNSYADYDVSVAGLRTEGGSLTTAKFFELSAQELDTYLPNSNKKSKLIVRRPDAASYAVSDAGDRTWSLRGTSAQGNACVVRAVVDDMDYTCTFDGLVYEAASGEAALSRPAFNLRSNAVAFVYAAQTETQSAGGKATTTEAISGFGEEVGLRSVSTVSGAATFRAALETLPMTAASTVYKQDGSLELTFDSNANGHKIGVLCADAAGNILTWGTARIADHGSFTFTPADGVAALYFFSFDYDASVGQLCTSSLIEVCVGTSAAMTLGIGHLSDEEIIYFNGKAAYVVNADAGSTAWTDTHSTATMTRDSASDSQYPVYDEQAVFLAKGLGYEINYRSARDILVSVASMLRGAAYNTSGPQLVALMTNADTAAANAVNTAVQAAAEKNSDIQSVNETLLEVNFGEGAAERAFAYNWINDGGYSVILADEPAPFGSPSVQAVEHAVFGQHLFTLSAEEYERLPSSIKTALGDTILRSAVDEVCPVPVLDRDEPLTLTVSTAPAAMVNQQLTTPITASADVTVDAAVGANLLRERVVYMTQADVNLKSQTTVDTLHEVPAYDGTCTEWNIALLDDSLDFSTDELSGYPTDTPSYIAYPGIADSYISVLVTDRAGTVKQYGRISYVDNVNESYYVNIDPASYDFGDRVYVLNEYDAADCENATVYASAPVLLWEKKVSGTLTVTPDAFMTGETLTIDDSDLKYASGTQWGFVWYYSVFTGFESTAQTWTATDDEDRITAGIMLAGSTTQCVFTQVNRAAALPVYGGTESADTLVGGTLYFDGYRWLIAGAATEGISAVRDNSTNGYYSDLSVSDALTLMRKDTVPVGDTPDTVISNGMKDTVLLTDTSDPDLADEYVWCDAASAENQLVFRPSYADVQKLKAAGADITAVPEHSATAVEYLLRNKDNDDLYVTVDAVGEFQQTVEASVDYTRDAVNLNRRQIVFYSPADCALTYDALSSTRPSVTGEWKLTVIDGDTFADDCIDSFNEYCSASSEGISFSGSTANANADRYVTAWAVRDGGIVWLDSVPCTQSGRFTVQFPLDGSIGYDAVYAVLRIDNGSYQTDVCSVPFTEAPFGASVELFVNGVRSSSGCDCSFIDEHTSAPMYSFFLHDSTVVHIDNLRNGYSIDRIAVVYPGIAEQSLSSYRMGDEYFANLTVERTAPIVRVYLTARESDIRVFVYDCYGDSVNGIAATVTAPASAYAGETYSYTVTPAYGYSVYEISTYSSDAGFNYPSLITPTDKPATYRQTMGSDSQTIIVTMEEAPTYPLTLNVTPAGGGTLMAKLPTGAALTGILEGETLPLRATAASGYVLTGITYHVGSGEEQVLAASDNGYAFTMPAGAAVLTAHFAPDASVTSAFVDVSSGTPQAFDASAVYTVNGEETEVFHAGDLVTATVTCPDNMAVAEISASPETVLTQTDKYTFTFTMPEGDLMLTYRLKAIEVKSAYLRLDGDINLVYAVQLPAGFSDAQAVFTYLGQTCTVTDSTTDTQGNTCFEFTHITPQCMGEAVDVTVCATMGGYTFSDTKQNYSVRTYCENMLARTDDTLLITLLSDLLTYGEEAQRYVGYKTDALVTEGLDLYPSFHPDIIGRHASFVGTADEDTRWLSAALVLRNNICMDFTFFAQTVADLTVCITVDGETQCFTDFTALGDNRYTVSFCGIPASAYDELVSASFFRDGVQVGNTLNYTVNTYLSSKQNTSDEALAALVHALYNYGESAFTYWAERLSKR